MRKLMMQIIKNGYNPPQGLYSLCIPYRSTFKELDFTEDGGKVGTFHKDLFYPMDSIFLMEEGQKFPVDAVMDTMIAEKFNKNNILAESNGYLIIKR